MKSILMFIFVILGYAESFSQTNTFPASGNVGIGTTTPNAILDVNGSTIITGQGNTLTLKKANNFPAIAFQGAVGTAVIEGGDNFLRAYVGGIQRFIILAEGNVGIGINSPTEKLSVKGKIRSQEIKVEMADWPDYVFAKDYQLPSLEETEKHIQEKGHLLGFPSAAEVKANGVDLGEMNAKLLKKIEELTLYLIDMKKENDQERSKQQEKTERQEKLIEQQQKDINELKSKFK
jgi:hypothetical protein